MTHITDWRYTSTHSSPRHHMEVANFTPCWHQFGEGAHRPGGCLGHTAAPATSQFRGQTSSLFLPGIERRSLQRPDGGLVTDTALFIYTQGVPLIASLSTAAVNMSRRMQVFYAIKLPCFGER